jgi:hypothetical protein
MNNNQLKLLETLIYKEELLARILVWLRTKNLYKECMEVVEPKLVE